MSFAFFMLIKILFSYDVCSDYTCNKILKVRDSFVGGKVKFQTLNILLQAKAVLKGIGY